MNELTEEQLNNMMHALGVKPQRKKLVMYRNRYSCNGNSGSWEDLVSKGLAERSEEGKTTWYFVSDKGKKIISSLTGARSDEE